MSDIRVGLIIEGNSADARREVERTKRGVDQLKRGNQELGRASQNYGRRAVQANRQVARSTRDLGRQTMSLTKMVGGLAAAYVAMRGIRAAKNLAADFIAAAREAEGFRVRLNTLLGSTYEGNRAFEEMAELAGQLPFEYREVMAAATDLSGVLEGGVDEIKQYMPIIADLAAVSGLSIQEATSQVIRMYSAGAASADMFRERGILAMLGFQAGVSYSAEETRRKLIEAWEDPASKFRGATEDLAQNWDGMTSMMSDSWFQFRDSMMEDTVLWDFLKTALDEFRMWWADALDWNQSEFDAWADGIIATIKYTGAAFTTLWDVVMAPKRIFDALIALGATMNTWLLKPLNMIGAVSDETYQKFLDGADAARNNVGRLNQTTSDFLAKVKEIEGKARDAFQLRQVNAAVEELVATNEDLFGAQKRVTQAMQETGEEGQKAMQSLNADIEKLIKTEELFAMSWRTNLEDRFQAAQDSLRTELEALEANRREQLQVINDAEREGLDSIVSYAELRRRVEEDYADRRRELEQRSADEVGLIWTDMVEDARQTLASGLAQGATQAIRDELIEEERAKDRAKDILQERLEDLDESLRDGTISKSEALEKREELYEDYRDRIAEIDKSIGERLKETLVDSLADAIDQMMATWLESGIIGLLSGEGLSGFSIAGAFGSRDGDATGGAVANAGAIKAITAAGKEYLPQVFGGTTSGAGQAVASQAAATGAETFALGPATGKIAPTAVLGAGGKALTTSGLTQAQATQILTQQSAYGGSSAAGGAASASWGAAGLAIPMLAGLAIKELGIGPWGDTPEYAKALRAMQSNGFAGRGPLGGQVGAGDGFSFFGGENAGFAAGFAHRQGVSTVGGGGRIGSSLADEGIAAFRGLELEGTIALLAEAQAAFAQTQAAGVQAFEDTGVSAAEMGRIIGDDVVDEVDLAQLGIQNLRGEMSQTRSGTIEYAEVTSEQFRLIARAINNGELRLRALRGEIEQNEREMEVLRDIGVTAAGEIARGAGQIGGAFWAAARDANAALRSIEDRTVNVGVNRSFGSGAPPPPGAHPGLAEGGVVSRRGLYELSEYNHPELVVPLSGGRSVPVEMRGGGSDGETKALLRSIDNRLANLQAQTTLDDRSVAALAGAISRPIVDAQKRETRHADNRGRSF